MTELDLRETLEHHISGVDIPPGDPLIAISRGRRRRKLRNGLAAGATTAALLAVPIVLLAGLGDDDRVVDEPASSPTSTPTPTPSPSLRYEPSPGVVAPGGTRTTALGDPMVYKPRTGSKTLLLPEPPADATDVSISVLCLSPGTVRYPDGASIQCGPGDVASGSEDPRASNYYLIKLSNHRAIGAPRTQGITLSFKVTPGMSWELYATYVHSEQVPWGVNAAGQTYGAENDHGTPDLVGVVATNGKSGYSYATDLNGPMPTSPADAQAFNDAYPNGHDIPVYESDGLTHIGVFHIEGGSGSSQ